jgi:hypothetical protein
MKSSVYCLTVIALLVMVPTVFAAWTITEDWTADYTDTQVYACAYNPTTDHVLLAAATSIPIYNASDGTATGSSLSLPTELDGTIFAIACAEDGAIFAHELYGDTFYWADESAAGEALTFTGASLMGIVRCLRAYGSGTNTRIYLTGDADDGRIQMITNDGSNWVIEELIAAPAAKSGVFSIPPAFTTVYGLQPWGSAIASPVRFDYSDTTWSENTSFVGEDPDPESATTYCVGGDYIPSESGEPAFVYIFYYNLGQMWALNADTGARIDGLDYTVPGFTTYAMNVLADTTNKKIYYASRRGATQGGTGTNEGVFGRLSYSAGPPPTPTPWEAAVEMDWQIYE